MNRKVQRQLSLGSSEHNLKESTRLEIVYRRLDTLKPGPGEPAAAQHQADSADRPEHRDFRL
jgi:hypothetical protein